MNRRELLRGLALGGAVIAGELWIPGKRLISIPKAARLDGHSFEEQILWLIYDSKTYGGELTYLYVGLHTSDPASTAEASYGDYARIALPRPGGLWAVSSSLVSNGFVS